MVNNSENNANTYDSIEYNPYYIIEHYNYFIHIQSSASNIDEMNIPPEIRPENNRINYNFYDPIVNNINNNMNTFYDISDIINT